MENQITDNNISQSNFNNPLPAPRKSNIFLIILFVILACLLIIGGVAAFLLLTPQGRAFLNSSYPTKDRTLSLVKSNMGKISNYQEEISMEAGGKTTTVQVLTQNDTSIFPKQKINAILPNTFTNSTITNLSQNAQSVIIANNEMFAQDMYDGSYYKITDSSPEQDFIKKLHALVLQNISKWMSDSVAKLNFDAKTDMLQFTSTQIPNSLLADLQVPNNVNVNGRFSVNINPKTYQISRFTLELQNVAAFNNISVSFLNYNNPDVASIQKPFSINEFGSFMQRESKYIRTEPNGIYDYLWNNWEKKYFSCDKCVNPIWDEDGDGLNNIQEFIFGSNPLLADSNGNGLNDSGEIQNKKNPVSSTVLSDEYAKAVKQLAVNQIGPVGLGDTKIGNAFKRDSVTIIKKEYLHIPKNAKTLYFHFRLSGNANNSVYFNVFFNNKLIFLSTLVPGQVVDQKSKTLAHVPIEQFAGQSGEITFVLNSFGPPGGGINVDLNTMRIDNNPVFPFLAY